MRDLVRVDPCDPSSYGTGWSLRTNGSLALGVAGRCCSVIGPSGLDAELDARRAQLDEADESTIAPARAAAAELAMRASAAAVVSAGSSSVLVVHHAQRLAREALFLLVFATRPPIRASLLERLGAT